MKVAPDSLGGRAITSVGRYAPEDVSPSLSWSMGVTLGFIIATKHPEWVAAVVKDLRLQGSETVLDAGPRMADLIVRNVPIQGAVNEYLL